MNSRMTAEPTTSPQSRFWATLRQRVEAQLRVSGATATADWTMHGKAALSIAIFLAGYAMLMLVADSVLLVVVGATAVSQGMVMIGLNVMHDGHHSAYTESHGINRLASQLLNLLGPSQQLWRRTHQVHHGFTNVHEFDETLEQSSLLRVSPHQKWRAIHRMQMFYAPFVYALSTLAWITIRDARQFLGRRIGPVHLGPCTVKEAWSFLMTKLTYAALALGLPLLLHDPLVVVMTFLGIHFMAGFTILLTFQLGHRNDVVLYPDAPRPKSQSDCWAQDVVSVTANFAPGRRFYMWWLGGLSYHIEHHLFPKLCHTRYPSIAPIVQRTCSEFGLPYHSFPSFAAAVRSHFSFLRRMGQKPSVL
jgi:linoleoyl-CoA desaturase